MFYARIADWPPFPLRSQVQWYIRTIASLICACGADAGPQLADGLTAAMATHAATDSSLPAFALRTLLPYLSRGNTPEPLQAVALWAAGEFGAEGDREAVEDAIDAVCGLSGSVRLPPAQTQRAVLALGKLAARSGGGLSAEGEALLSQVRERGGCMQRAMRAAGW